MWLNTARRLRQALRRYRTDKSLETVLHADWRRAPDLQRFFDDIEKRLHGEEITRLQQKQAEYLALQNQINPHFLYNALEAIRSDALLADCTEIAETTEALATFSVIRSPTYRNMSLFPMNWTMQKTILPFSAAASATSSPWSWKWKTRRCWKRACPS